jgi:hypothetical protein
MRLRLSTWAFAVAMAAGLVAGSPRRVAAQVPADSSSHLASAHAACRDPHAQRLCRDYFLLELTGTVRMAGSSSNDASCLPVSGSACAQKPLPAYLAWDLGWMRNITASRAIGASFQIGGTEQGVRMAARARQRTWLSPNLAFDAAAGPLMMQLQPNGGTAGVQQTWGATADVGLGRARLGLLTLGVDLARQRGRTVCAFQGGLRLESRGVVFGSAIVGAAALALAAALSDVHY